MKAGAVIKWLSQLDPEEYVAVAWWTLESVKASLDIEDLDAKDWRHIVHEWEMSTQEEAESMSDTLTQTAREVLEI